MIEYDVQVDKDSLREAQSLFEFVGGNSDDALRIAINKAGPKIKTAASKAIRSQVRLKAKYVNDKKRLRFDKASRSSLSGAIRAESRGILLSRFSTDTLIADPNRAGWIKPPVIPPRGIRVKVKPSGSAEVMGKEWFYMVLPNSRALAIARRKPGGATGAQGGKYDIAYGPSVSQVFRNETRDRLLPEAGAELQKQMLEAMRYLLQKKYPR